MKSIELWEIVKYNEEQGISKRRRGHGTLYYADRYPKIETFVQYHHIAEFRAETASDRYWKKRFWENIAADRTTKLYAGDQ